jgi:hypothetical protein
MKKALRCSTIQGSGHTGVDGLTTSIIAHNSRSREPPGARTAFLLVTTRKRVRLFIIEVK